MSSEIFSRLISEVSQAGKQIREFDGYLAKLNPSGSMLIYSTYLGGSNLDSGLDVAVDSAGQAFVLGFTNSTNFPTTAGAYQIALGGGVEDDAFVAKFSATGSALVYSTYLGGSGYDHGNSLAIDSGG